jgi:hypothetical protein
VVAQKSHCSSGRHLSYHSITDNIVVVSCVLEADIRKKKRKEKTAEARAKSSLGNNCT